MKRYLLAAMILLFTSLAHAQDLPQGLGIQIGFAQPILRLNSPNEMMTKDSLVNTTILNGLKVGLVYDATFVKGFGASIGLNYTFAQGQTQWAAKTHTTLYPQTRTRTIYHQMELFVDWQYKFEIAQQTYIILYTGPTLQCALATNRQSYEKNMAGDVTEHPRTSLLDYKDKDNSQDLQRLNVTWGVGIGFQYQRYFLRGGYDFGLINPYKISNFNEMGYQIDRNTRGRFDQWNIRLGVYLWEN